MAGDASQLQAELQRLQSGPRPGERPSGVGTVRFVARCPLGAADVLARATSLLKTIDELALTGWPADEQVAKQIAGMVYISVRPTNDTRAGGTVACLVEGITRRRTGEG